MSDEPKPSTALDKREPVAVEYIPLGNQEKVRLTVSIIQNLIAVKTKSGRTCSDRDALRFMGMCQAKHLNPLEGDCFLIGYDGREGPSFALVTAHQAYLKRAELHPEFNGLKSGIIVRESDGKLRDLEGDFFDEGQTVVGGWATVFFKGRQFPMHKRLRLARFNVGRGIWLDDPAGMICKCAEADALRSAFPTMLGGLYLREELEVQAPPQMTRPDFTASKPLFNGANLKALPAETPPAPDNGSQNGPGNAPEPPGRVESPKPAQSQGQPPPPPKSDNGDLGPQSEAQAGSTLAILRAHCRMAKINEGTVLDYLAQCRSTDGSIASLDELLITDEPLAKQLLADWLNIVEMLKKLDEKRSAK